MSARSIFVIALGTMAAIGSSPPEGSIDACCNCLASTSEDGSKADTSDNCLPDELDTPGACAGEVSVDVTAAGCALQCFAECRGTVESNDTEVKLEGQNAIATYDGHLYLTRSPPLSWPDARDACKDEDAQLIVVDDQGEMDFIVESGGTGWIGLNDRETEGDFEWVDGSALTFDLFADGEPNDANTGEDCVTGFYEWNDDSCDNTYGFVCEAD